MNTYTVTAYIVENSRRKPISTITVKAASAFIAEYAFADKLTKDNMRFDCVVATQKLV
ncbi:hypothetical protein [Larkinella sp. C7]|uniref:hypothetical protein n=1 Tax=Larkinella sp. C7 TaxID=2576607 RepID=UPI001486DAEB|nr:hypothetical protein [Larkinella sp. C7]